MSGLCVKLLQVLTQGKEQVLERVVQAVELARKTALVQRLHAPMLLHVAPGGGQIAPEKTRPEQGRGQQLGVGQVPPVRGLRARKAQKIVNEAVHCYRLFSHGAVGMSVVEDLKPSCSLSEQTFFIPTLLRNLG